MQAVAGIVVCTTPADASRMLQRRHRQQQQQCEAASTTASTLRRSCSNSDCDVCATASSRPPLSRYEARLRALRHHVLRVATAHASAVTTASSHDGVDVSPFRLCTATTTTASNTTSSSCALLYMMLSMTRGGDATPCVAPYLLDLDRIYHACSTTTRTAAADDRNDSNDDDDVVVRMAVDTWRRRHRCGACCCSGNNDNDTSTTRTAHDAACDSTATATPHVLVLVLSDVCNDGLYDAYTLAPTATATSLSSALPRLLLLQPQLPQLIAACKTTTMTTIARGGDDDDGAAAVCHHRVCGYAVSLPSLPLPRDEAQHDMHAWWCTSLRNNMHKKSSNSNGNEAQSPSHPVTSTATTFAAAAAAAAAAVRVLWLHDSLLVHTLYYCAPCVVDDYVYHSHSADDDDDVVQRDVVGALLHSVLQEDEKAQDEDEDEVAAVAVAADHTCSAPRKRQRDNDGDSNASCLLPRHVDWQRVRRLGWRSSSVALCSCAHDVNGDDNNALLATSVTADALTSLIECVATARDVAHVRAAVRRLRQSSTLYEAATVACTSAQLVQCTAVSTGVRDCVPTTAVAQCASLSAPYVLARLYAPAVRLRTLLTTSSSSSSSSLCSSRATAAAAAAGDASASVAVELCDVVYDVLRHTDEAATLPAHSISDTEAAAATCNNNNNNNDDNVAAAFVARIGVCGNGGLTAPLTTAVRMWLQQQQQQQQRQQQSSQQQRRQRRRDTRGRMHVWWCVHRLQTLVRLALQSRADEVAQLLQLDCSLREAAVCGAADDDDDNVHDDGYAVLRTRLFTLWSHIADDVNAQLCVNSDNDDDDSDMDTSSSSSLSCSSCSSVDEDDDDDVDDDNDDMCALPLTARKAMTLYMTLLSQGMNTTDVTTTQPSSSSPSLRCAQLPQAAAATTTITSSATVTPAHDAHETQQQQQQQLWLQHALFVYSHAMQHTNSSDSNSNSNTAVRRATRKAAAVVAVAPSVAEQRLSRAVAAWRAACAHSLAFDELLTAITHVYAQRWQQAAAQLHM